MLAREMLIKEFAYNHWANGRILDQAENGDGRTVGVEGRSGRPQPRELLAPFFSIERVWRLLSAHGLIREGEIPGMDQLANVAALRAFSDTEAQYMDVLLRDWSDDSFSEEVLVTRWDGRTYPLVRWHMLHHLLMHSMQHRSEAAVLLTQYGRSPGDIDFLFFL